MVINSEAGEYHVEGGWRTFGERLPPDGKRLR
jgi:hypothetical protein